MRVQRIAATVPAWMRAMLCIVWLLLGTTAIAQPAARSQAVSADWRFRLLPGDAQLPAHPQAAGWAKAAVPGTVHTDLFANGVDRGSLRRRAGSGAAMDRPGRLGSTWAGFDVDAATLARPHAELVFEGLVYLRRGRTQRPAAAEGRQQPPHLARARGRPAEGERQRTAGGVPFAHPHAAAEGAGDAAQDRRQLSLALR